jgi:hypothetical protein
MILLREVHRRARRQLSRPCFACLLPVLPGDEYREMTYKDDCLYSLVEHRQCADALLPGVVNQDDELDQAYLIHYFDTEHDTTPEWRAWYRQRIAAL